MILFGNPGACSLAVHIALIETGMSYKLVGITREKQTADGRDFLKLNPKGFIPALELDDGTVLAESLALLVYVAEQAGAMLAKDGLVRYRVLENLSFMTTEIHGNFKPFWKNAAQPDKDKARQILVKHFITLAEQLGDKSFLSGEAMTIADPYLFVMLLWAVKHEIEAPERLSAYLARMRKEPSVSKALVAEGLT